MDEPRERERRVHEIRKAMDQSDREEQSQEDRDVGAIAQKWEKVIEKRDLSGES